MGSSPYHQTLTMPFGLQSRHDFSSCSANRLNNIHQKRQKSLAASNEKENKSCIEKHYSPGD
jgi:hypothetical protein